VIEGMPRPLLAFDTNFAVRRVITAPTPASPAQLDLFGEPGGVPSAPAEVPREEMLGELIGLINPLATVVGFTDLLLDEALAEEPARMARAANDAGREIEQRVRRLLARLDETRREAAGRAFDHELEVELDRRAAAQPLHDLG
jgi:hypothetical protein